VFLLPYDPDPRPGGDKGEPDLILPDGTTVQIKFREKPEYDFALPNTNPESFNTDIGILAARASQDLLVDDVQIIGWITRDEFLIHATTQNYTQRADGDRLAVGPSHFRPIGELLARVYSRELVAA
jgi:hypothetical protein